ncbi:MAG: T9SS type A sorting domain-containing protein [Bacteroidetes bacterium]|nr:T9SS type A sorting domain-containing protein [Bacteroidota bacterium]
MNIRYLLSMLMLTTIGMYAQHPCSVAKAKAHTKHVNYSKSNKKTTSVNPPENDYDVKFYHLNLNAENNSVTISGNVRCLAKVVAPTMDTFVCVLHTNHTVDSVYINGVRRNFVRQDSLVKTSVGTTLMQNQMVDATVYYNGSCPNSGASAIGNGFSTGTSPSWGNSVTWSLSESFVAYEWFPCKQDLKDKIDSSWVFVTTDSANMVGSNGLLKNVVTIGDKKRFEWKSRYPIDYYLISVSIAKYKPYNLYAKPLYLPGDSILIQNFIYTGAINNSSWITNQRPQLDQIKPTLELYCKLYGMYPFYKEKYGHCMAPFGGGMEHQTMTTQYGFDFTIDAHELAHQWWGDHVTCKAWKDIWINEGWASYNEYISNQYITSQATADNNMLQAHTNIMSQAGGSCYFTNSDTMNSNIIFDSRLTYDKGGAIIHSLRFAINNDSLFFQLCRGFQVAHSFNVASVQDFISYFNANSGQNFTQFFNQWYYGEGYPTFNVKWNQVGSNFYLQSTQTTSMPSSVPLFITPLEYKITRTGLADTVIRVMHGQVTENYFYNLTGTVTAIAVDPKNWIINKAIGPVKDANLVGVDEIAAQEPLVFVGPNPTSDVLNINLYKTAAKANVEIFDMHGSSVLKDALEGQWKGDISQLAHGTYIVQISDLSGALIRSVKIVKD